jgi:4-hydroxy-tetrahydrodipicolinate synthase
VEHKRVVQIVVESVDRNIPVIAGAGSNNPTEALEYTLHAQEAGADAVLHVAGYYNRPNQEGLYQHFKFVHDNSDIPIIIYNIPPRAIVDVLPDTMARLAQLPRIVGVKDATGDLSRIAKERIRIRGDFCYLSGEDPTALVYNASGGHGCISVTANVAPALCVQLQNACARGDFGGALQLQDKLMPLHEALFSEPSPAGAKYGASLLDLCSAECRVPVVALSAETKNTIRQVMQQLELI